MYEQQMSKGSKTKASTGQAAMSIVQYHLIRLNS